MAHRSRQWIIVLPVLSLLSCDGADPREHGADHGAEVASVGGSRSDGPRAVAAPEPTTRPNSREPDFFLPLSIADAGARARDENKTIFAYFYSNTCAACLVMKHKVFSDPWVSTLLRRHTIPIRINVTEHPFLAAMYGVRAVPVCIFFRADGSRIERIDGAPPTNTFLSWASYYAVGRDNVYIAREGVLEAHIRLAESLVGKRKLDSALEEYLWVWDHGSELEPDFLDGTAARVAHSLGGIAERHVRARSALEERRAEAEHRLLTGSGTAADIRVVYYLDFVTKRVDATLALYDRIKRERLDDPLMPEWYDVVFDALRKARRYEDIAAGTDTTDAVNKLFVAIEERRPRPYDHSPATRYTEAVEMHLRYYAGRISQYYEVLLGLGRHEEADALATRLLEAAPGADTLNALAWAGYLTGQPTEQHLKQARQAYDMSFGNSAAIVDTLARIMALRGQRAEAVNLLEQGLKTSRLPSENEILRRCRDEIRSAPASEKPGPPNAPEPTVEPGEA